MPTASQISIKETLDLLNDPAGGVGNGVAQGAYALWLGSGISRERVVGLDGVLAKLLEFLRARANGSPACEFTKALNAIVDMAGPSAAERAQIDIATPVAGWGCLKDLLQRLWNQYAKVLSVELAGQPLDYLLWTGLDFPNTFSNQEPDAEHLVIGMLALEGVVTELASANWDGLLEAAMKELGHDDFFRSTVNGEDLRGPAAAAVLYKFHGCAIRAIADEAAYRPLLVARSAQITGWNANPAFRIVRDQISALAQVKRTLMIGMSAQDENIKHLFAKVNEQQPWKWNEQPTPVVFSAQELGDDQKNLLLLIYGQAEYEAHRAAVCEAARLQAYAKPLLLALLLHVLTAKAEVLAADAEVPKLSAHERGEIATGIRKLRDKAADAGNSDRIAFARSIARGLARARHQLQNGSSGDGAQRYFPIDTQPANLMKDKLGLQASGQREAAVALGLIGLEDASAWDCTVDDPTSSQSGALRLGSAASGARVFFAANDDAITSLIECGSFAEDDDDAVVICSGRIAGRQQRSPSGTWRTGSVGPRYLAMKPLLNDALSLSDLRDKFRGEIGL